MELRQLRYFVTVAEELHFGRAAERLHIVQPAVSQQISRLERELGVRLFDRSPRRVRLTAAGERLLAEARAALAAADRVTAVAATLADTRRGLLRVGVSPGMTAGLDRGLAALRGANPHLDVDLELVSLPAADQLAAVARGELDFALVRAARPAPGLRLQVVELWRDPVVVAFPAAHPLARRPAVKLQDLADLPLRLPDPRCDPLLRDLVLDACRQAGFQPRLGRPTGAVHDTLVELGTGAPAWTALYADAHPAAAGDAGGDAGFPGLPIPDPTAPGGVVAGTAAPDGAAAGTGTGISKVAVRPTDPPLTVPACLVLPASTAPSCVHGLRAAFTAA